MMETILFLFFIIGISAVMGYAVCFLQKEEQIEQIKYNFFKYKKDQEAKLSKYIIED